MHGMVWVYLSQRQPTSNQFPTSKAFLGLVRRRSVPPSLGVAVGRAKQSAPAVQPGPGTATGTVKERRGSNDLRRGPARSRSRQGPESRADAAVRGAECAECGVGRGGKGLWGHFQPQRFRLALAPGTLKYGFSVLKTFFNLYRRPSISNRSTPPATCPSSRSSGARRSLAAWPRRSTWRRAAGGAAGSRVCPAAPAA